LPAMYQATRFFYGRAAIEKNRCSLHHCDLCY